MQHTHTRAYMSTGIHISHTPLSTGGDVTDDIWYGIQYMHQDEEGGVGDKKRPYIHTYLSTYIRTSATPNTNHISGPIQHTHTHTTLIIEGKHDLTARIPQNIHPPAEADVTSLLIPAIYLGIYHHHHHHHRTFLTGLRCPSGTFNGTTYLR